MRYLCDFTFGSVFYLNSLVPGRCCNNFKSTIFKLIIQNSKLGTCCEIAFIFNNATGPHLWDVNIGSGNGLLPSGNKPLPEPMLTQIYVVTRPQWVHHCCAVCSIMSFWTIFITRPNCNLDAVWKHRKVVFTLVTIYLFCSLLDSFFMWHLAWSQHYWPLGPETGWISVPVSI